MDSDSLRIIGTRIGEIRRQHHMTQETLAEMLGVSPKHISHAECGTSSLSPKNLVQFCKIFDCSFDYIMMGKSTDAALANLPDKICQILYSKNDKEIKRLNRYLQIYIELLETRK